MKTLLNKKSFISTDLGYIQNQCISGLVLGHVGHVNRYNVCLILNSVFYYVTNFYVSVLQESIWKNTYMPMCIYLSRYTENT